MPGYNPTEDYYIDVLFEGTSIGGVIASTHTERTASTPVGTERTAVSAAWTERTG